MYLFPDKAAILAGPVKAVTLFHEQRHKAAYFSEISQQFRALPILERDKLRISTLNRVNDRGGDVTEPANQFGSLFGHGFIDNQRIMIQAYRPHGHSRKDGVQQHTWASSPQLVV